MMQAHKVIIFSVLLLGFTSHTVVCAAEAAVTIPVAFLKKVPERPPRLSNLILPPENEGEAGGRQAIMDNNTTGQFIGFRYTLRTTVLDPEDDLKEAFTEAFDLGIRQFVLDVGAEDLLMLADSEQGRQSWFYNAGSYDDRLRMKECRRNVVHVLPSHAMRSDALAQYLVMKKWTKWFLVVGRRKSDLDFASAVRKSAKKFGAKIVAEKQWEYGPDARRTAASTVPVFTQGIEYDVLVVADVIGEFGEYLTYRTWDPRPVVGTQGLVPVSWHRTHEQWGAAQIQSRFLNNFEFYMSEKDYNVWSAIRVVGTAVTKTGSAEYPRIAEYVRSPEFALAGYKGQKMSLRSWNLQLRQPILLVSATSLVSVSPQRPFLHERSLLDTMGYDKHETSCGDQKEAQ